MTDEDVNVIAMEECNDAVSMSPPRRVRCRRRVRESVTSVDDGKEDDDHDDDDDSDDLDDEDVDVVITESDTAMVAAAMVDAHTHAHAHAENASRPALDVQLAFLGNAESTTTTSSASVVYKPDPRRVRLTVKRPQVQVQPLVVQPTRRDRAQSFFAPKCATCELERERARERDDLNDLSPVVECLHVEWVQLCIPRERQLTDEGRAWMREMRGVHPASTAVADKRQREEFARRRAAVFHVIVFGRTSAVSRADVARLFGTPQFHDPTARYPMAIPLHEREMDEFAEHGSVYVPLTHALALYVWRAKRCVLKLIF